MRSRETLEATHPDDAHPIARPLARCPACGSARLDPVVEREERRVHFLCRDCSRCWHVELGYVQRVTPEACAGCPERERCATAYSADHPERQS
jgi:hypothetical protein